MRVTRTDRTHRDVRTAVEGLGCSFLDLHALGKEGVPDAVVGIGGVIEERKETWGLPNRAINVLVEIKAAREDRVDQTKQVRAGQREFAETWRGLPVWLIVDDVSVIKMIRWVRRGEDRDEPEKRGPYLGYGLERWVK